MLKNKTKLVAILLVVFMLVSTFSTVFADDEAVTAPETEVVAENTTDVEQTIAEKQAQDNSYKKSDVYLAEKEVTVDYIVDGNLFVCADTVTINSQIGGDAFICAKKIVIEKEGYVFSNLFATAQSIEIKGVVYGAFLASQDLTISGGYIYRDLKAVAQTINMSGAVGRNASISCNTLNFNTVEGEEAIIYGDLEYSSNTEATIPEGTVDGTVNFTQHSNSESNVTTATKILNYLFDIGRFVAFVLIIWAVLLLIAPKFLASSKEFIGKKSLKLFGCGLLSFIVVPIVCSILLFLGLTVNVSLFLVGLYVLGAMLAKTLFVISANDLVCSKLKVEKNIQKFGILILTSIVAWIVTKIPYIGAIASIIFACIGLGILVTSILPKKAKKEVEAKSE